jgi:tetratricopeptide (TPR) repeat protein
MLTSLLLLASTAFADDDYRSLLSQAKTSLLAGEYRDARDLLVKAEEVAPTADTLLTTTDLTRLYFYRGVLFWRASPESAALEAWKQALTINPSFVPEADLLGDASERDTFLALADEVRAAGDVGLDLPEDPGEAIIYVDGKAVGDDDTVLAGMHFIQVKCEDGDFAAAWYTYGAAPSNYLTICDGGMYKGARASSSSASKSGSSSKSSSKSSTKSGGGKDKGEATGLGGKDIAGIALIAAGAVGAGATVFLYDQAAIASEAYEQRDAAADQNPGLRESSDAYYDDVLLPRYLRTYAVGGASGAFLAGGIVLVLVGAEGPMAAPLPGGGGVFTWSGRF